MIVTTYVIIAANIIMFVLSQKDDSLVDRYKFSVGAILHDKQYFRFITSGFLHADLGHIFFNMYSFFVFAKGIEKHYGPFLVLLIFLASVIGGSIFSLIFNRKNNYYTALGASGGVAGIIYASIFLMEESSIYIIPFPIPIPDKIFAIGYILVSYFLMRRRNDNIGHEAHLGGAVTGTLVAIAIIPWIILQRYELLIAMMLPFLIILALNMYLKKK